MKNFIWTAIFFTLGYATPIHQVGDNQCLSKPTHLTEILKLKEELVLAVRKKEFSKAEEITVKIEKIEEEANDLKNKVSINIIVGGKDSNWNYRRDAQIVNLSNETSTCHNFPDYPFAIRYATGAIVSGLPIICGGESGESVYSECYHHSKATNSWTFLTNMATKRTLSASVPVNGKLLVLGGRDGDINRHRLATSEYVSPDGDASQPGPDLPGPQDGHCAVKLANGQVMLLGGGYPDRKSVIIFHPDTEKFDQSLPPLTFDRYNAGCAAFKSPLHDNREVVLAVGGLYGQATAELLDYSQPNPAWTEITGLPTEYDDDFNGARAVTSASGKGAIVQYKKHFYELTCEISGCTWRILPNQLNPGVKDAVMMTLPSEYDPC